MICGLDTAIKAAIKLERIKLEEKEKAAERERIEKEKLKRIRISRTEDFCENILAPVIEENISKGIAVTEFKISHHYIDSKGEYFCPLKHGYYSKRDYRETGDYYFNITEDDAPNINYEIDTESCIAYLKKYCYDVTFKKGKRYNEYNCWAYREYTIMTIKPMPQCL